MTRVTQAEFARICDVNRSTVTRWIQSGRIELAPDGSIDADAASRMREATESPLPHHQARKAGIEMAKQAGGRSNPLSMPDIDRDGIDAVSDDDSAAGVSARYKLAMARERESKAEMAAMEVDKLAGVLVERSEVDYVMADFGALVRSALEGLPDRLSGELAALGGNTNALHKALDDALRDVLSGMAEQMKRRMDALGHE